MSILSQLRQLMHRLVPGGGLAEKTAKSGIWALVTNLTDRGLQLLMVAILARLLDPADFGLLGIALLTLTAFKRFSKLGFDEALIQKPSTDVDHFLDTYWSLEVARGLLLAGLILVGAPYVAAFFGEPRAEPLLQVIAVTPILLGLKNPAIVYFRKDLDFHKQFVYTLSGSTTNFVVATTLAILTQSVWALVLGYVASDVARLLTSYALHSYRPWVRFNKDEALDLFGFGKWMTGSGIIFFIINQGDDAVVGWALTAASLGFYQVAYQFAKAPATEISQIISSVAFPAYSQLQDDVGALRAAFFRTLQVTMLIAFPMSVGIALVAPVFVEAIFGQQWLPMVPVMQLVAVYGLVIAMGSTYSPIWKAIGRPDFMTKLGAFRLVLTAILIIPATQQYGITGAAAAVLVALVPVVPLDIYLTIKSVETTPGRFLRELAYPASASLVMGGVVFWTRESLALGSPLLTLAVLVVEGALVYALAVLVLETQLRWGIRQNIGGFLNAM